MKKNIAGELFYKMLIPTVLTNLVTAVGSFADAAIVGNILGDLAISAVTFSVPIFMLINTLADTVAVGGATAMSVDTGKGDTTAKNKVFSVAVCYATLLGLALTVAGVAFMDSIVLLLGATGEVAPLVSEYSYVIIAFAPAFLLNITFAFFVRNDGRPKLAMAGMLTSIGINIVFDFLFVGYFNMGIAGAAWAMVLSQLVSALIIASHFFSKRNTLRFSISLNVKMFARIVKSGVGTSMSFIYQMVTMLVLNHFIMSVAGAEGMVVYTVVYNISLIAMCIFEGISQTVQPIVSVYHGEKNDRGIADTMKRAFKVGIVVCAVIIVLLELFPASVGMMFGIDAQLLDMASVATRLFAPAMLLMTINVILSYYYQSRENRVLPLIIVPARNVVFLLGSMYIAVSAIGFNGFWVAYIIAEALTLLLVFIATLIIRKKRHHLHGLLLLEHNPAVFSTDLVATETEVARTLEAIREFLKDYPKGASNRAVLSAEELMFNIVKHSGRSQPALIGLMISVQGGKISLVIRDNGVAFDPTAQTDDSVDVAGNLGLFLVKKTVSGFNYSPS